MITSVASVTGSESRTTDVMMAEVDYLSSTLSILRDSDVITNDEFLEAGAIQGGLSLLSAMISNGADDSEVNVQILSLKRRAEELCERYPDIDTKIESRR
ncbi:MAG: hypothetical protein CMG56_07390 [Candidatus Marinimicrobia bacterium]|nr:hypothetical protein [Candidatus Neomarinimicrobiota bacterium]